ncbi:hypothetical protein CC80DRAFT_599437 [Byssothecium circinans]|uniref:BZIP domain-containing protein n=1 Tax=Byssothecium circinans TaxID=147558 RepID=A0A6A5TDC9_9PLEO|nr:hypothetical protein CC80DRAFT_599437 [Byssothecium circinans]
MSATTNAYDINVRRQDDHSPYPQPGKRFGYAYWLQPVLKANDPAPSITGNTSSSAPNNPPVMQGTAHLTPTPVPTCKATSTSRGRGRPRVNKVRDTTTIEKRRAQVREAQRTYQRRKDSDSASERRRSDEVLEAMFDLSTDIETLLQTAVGTGALVQNNDLSECIRNLWFSYNVAIKKPCMLPDLKILQVKNDRRCGVYGGFEARMETAPTGMGLCDRLRELERDGWSEEME